ncbi:uncharacterized protein LOC133311901 [Gastrolobium bilobum]|uniref:uncharacterized protein LOC133311901 n=1 Tax=Gastrolobium bilobum TaxID=150636 RepID=UPI002AAFF105|nr:uncharacterized protein LOC133311901 [Gastrolobium bilobum]
MHERIVKSLSSDEAVWDAILNNEVVRELRESISADEAHVLPDGTAHSDSLTTRNVVSMFVTVKAKFMEVIEKITKIVNQLFQHTYQKIGGGGNGSDSDNLKEKLKACLMLTIMVLLVAMVNRANS